LIVLKSDTPEIEIKKIIKFAEKKMMEIANLQSSVLSINKNIQSNVLSIDKIGSNLSKKFVKFW